MSELAERYFNRSIKLEVELIGICVDTVTRGLINLNWSFIDQFWIPDIQVSLFTRDKEEFFLVEEIYFDPQVSGTPHHIEELKIELASYKQNP